MLKRLEVAHRKRQSNGSHMNYWRCECSYCGNITVVAASNIKPHSGCGCQRGKHSITHGHSGTTSRKKNKSPTYATWQSMKKRCSRPEKIHYFGKVTVCDRWKNSFENFLEDMGERPDGMTLDRYPDPNGNYEPNNCRWATPLQQRHNRGSK